jgi:lipopolysaccharide biosynthesis glycosyltransferase
MSINIAFGFDDRYVKYAAAAVKSVLETHNFDGGRISFYFLSLGKICRENKNKFIESLNAAAKNPAGFEINFIEIQSKEFEGLPSNKTLTAATYLRLLLSQILPQTVDKIIYLDCDLIVNNDIRNLWDIDITDYCLAAVKDYDSSKNSILTAEKKNYFNAGVLFLNLKALRSFDFYNKWKNFIQQPKNLTKLYMFDQDILNVVIPENKVLLISKKYNVMPLYALEIERKNAIIIHFPGFKPWNALCIHPYQNLFWKYAKGIKWKIRKETLFEYFFKFMLKQPFFFVKSKYYKLTFMLIADKMKIFYSNKIKDYPYFWAKTTARYSIYSCNRGKNLLTVQKNLIKTLLLFFLKFIILTFKSLFFKHIYIPYLEICITTKCSLNCKDCANYIPKINKTNPKEISLENFKKYIDNLLSYKKLNLYILNILGGEPLLHKDIAEIVLYALKQERIAKVFLTTNGTMQFKDDLISIMEKYRDKILIRLSNYTKNKELTGRLKNREISDKLKKAKIYYETVQDFYWIRVSPIKDYNRSAEQNKIYFKRCFPACLHILDGKLFLCPQSAAFDVLGICQSNNSISLNKSVHKESWINFLKTNYLASCNYCNFPDDKLKEKIIPAIQE